jgi:hypothetical protein
MAKGHRGRPHNKVVTVSDSNTQYQIKVEALA